MVVAAVIVVSDSDLSPLTLFGGLSLLKRAVLTAQKAGATTCYVSLGGESAWLRQELVGDARITNQIVWGLPEPSIVSAADRDHLWLLYPVDALFRHPLALQLAGTDTQGRLQVLPDANGAPLLVVGSGSEVVSMCQRLARQNSFAQAVSEETGETKKISSPQGHFLDCLRTVDDTPRLEHAMLRSLENSKDGVVDTYLNRKFSRPITRWLLRTPLTPNQITLLACSLSIVGGLCFLPGGYWGPLFGALLLQLSAVLDCCDGEVARIKFMESPLGDTLDIVCDTIGAIAIFLGIGAAVWQNGGSAYALPLGGVLAVGGALSFPFVTLAEKTEDAGRQRGGWEDTLIHNLLIGLTNRDYSLLIIAGALAGRLSWFLWGAAVGSHVFWMFLAWLLFRAGRFGLLRTMRGGRKG
jgi:1L-myo-inositol 1-phosphate cytidylyltransferase / CDP-L-myo-inositol myo-inositolphosphotransferase